MEIFFSVLSHFWIAAIVFPCKCCSMISDSSGASFGLCGPGDFGILRFAFIFLFLPSVQFPFAGIIASGIPYPAHKKNEATFQAIFFALFRLLGYYISAESHTNEGRIDAVAETEKFVFIFEFKLDDDKTALSQIKEKEYFKKYELSGKKIFLIGVTFSTEKGQIADWQTEEI